MLYSVEFTEINLKCPFFKVLIQKLGCMLNHAKNLYLPHSIHLKLY